MNSNYKTIAVALIVFFTVWLSVREVCKTWLATTAIKAGITRVISK